MKIVRIANNPAPLVYRICILRHNPRNPSQLEIRPLFRTDYRQDYVWTRIAIGRPILTDVHVGTKAKFCLAYYSGCAELHEGEQEVLLTLQVPASQASKIPRPEEDAHMGGEAIISNPVLVKIEDIDQAHGNPNYQ